MSIVSLQDIRDRGVTVAMADDATVNAAILIWENAFEVACGQWFEERANTATMDGDGTTLTFLNVPIISITSIKNLERGVTIDPVDYVVYANRSWIGKDDRSNPKIIMQNGQLFDLGRRIWEVIGTFGYIEPDDSAPKLVKEAMTQLIIEKLLTPDINDAASLMNAQFLPGNNSTVLTEEITDDHKLKYTYTSGKTRANINQWLTNNPFVLGVIKKYLAPIRVESQIDWSLLEGRPSDAQLFTQIFG